MPPPPFESAPGDLFDGREKVGKAFTLYAAPEVEEKKGIFFRMTETKNEEKIGKRTKGNEDQNKSEEEETKPHKEPLGVAKLGNPTPSH